eukprot:3411576-Alexandrium_andersonii.AAC.1
MKLQETVSCSFQRVPALKCLPSGTQKKLWLPISPRAPCMSILSNAVQLGVRHFGRCQKEKIRGSTTHAAVSA